MNRIHYFYPLQGVIITDLISANLVYANPYQFWMKKVKPFQGNYAEVRQWVLGTAFYPRAFDSYNYVWGPLWFGIEIFVLWV